MATINSFIENNYKVVYRHPDSKEEDWDTFLLCESHNDEVMKNVNAEFIKTFSAHDSTMLLEAVPSLAMDQRPRSASDAHNYIGQGFSRNRILGWDIDNYFKLDSKRIAILMAKKVLIPYYSSQGNDYLKDLNIKQKLQSPITTQKNDWKSKENTDEVRFMVQYLDELGNAVDEMAEEIQLFVKEKITTFEAEKEVVVKKHNEVCEREEMLITRLQENSNEVDSTEYINVLDDEFRLRGEITKTDQIITDSVLQKCQELQSRIFQLIEESFPDRINAMIKTLQNVRSLIGEKGNIFLSAGTRHLFEEHELPKNHPKSLTKFYEYISSKKNIIILLPKKTNEHIVCNAIDDANSSEL